MPDRNEKEGPGVPLVIIAERVGFEPSEEVSPLTRLAGEPSNYNQLILLIKIVYLIEM